MTKKTNETTQRVFLAAYDNAEAAKVVSHLRRVHGCSDGRHALVETPEAADTILIGGIGNEMGQWDYMMQTARQPLIDRFPEKCFTVSYRDTPLLFNRGVYESAPATGWNAGRCVTGSYELSGHYNAAVRNSEHCAKDLLFSFIGRMSYPVRRRLLKLPFRRKDIVLEDTSTFHYWDSAAEIRKEHEARFAQVMARSKFCLCPRGVGAGSIRLFEAMRAGIAPVILADKWIAPTGLPWDEFSIRLREDEVHRLEDAVVAREQDYAAMGALARRYWEECFAESSYFDYVVSRCMAMRDQQRVPESIYWSMRHAYVGAQRVRAKARSILGR